MSTLGLDDRPSSDDNFFKRLFWPNANPSEVDTLGQQGMWVCLVLGALAFVVTAIGGHPIVALFMAAIYVLGGMGVRERSVGAAVCIASLVMIFMLASMLLLGIPPGPLDLLTTCLLLANVRGTWIASKFAAAEDEEMPERLNATFTDKLIDQWPSAAWPKMKIAFFVLFSVFVLLWLMGVARMAAIRRAPISRVPSAEYKVR